MVPYLSSAEYQNLNKKSSEASNELGNVQKEVGLSDLYNQLNRFLDSQDYSKIWDELTAKGKDLGFPSRLNLARLASQTILNLTNLDTVASQRVSNIGLVTFTTYASKRQSLTSDTAALGSIVDKLSPQNMTDIGGGLKLALQEINNNGTAGQPSAIILLTDGWANRGMSTQKILADIPALAQKSNTHICAVGFGNKESDVDSKLLSGLADATHGSYLFAKSGEELVSFFVTCRQGLVSTVANQFTGEVGSGQEAEAGKIEVAPNTGVLSVTLTYLAGNLEMVLVDPSGQEVGQGYPGVNVQQSGSVQLVTLKNPMPDQWVVRVRAKTAGSDSGKSLYLVVVASELKPTPTITPTMTPTLVPTPTLWEATRPVLSSVFTG
jgi:hypothetical protein